MWLRALLLYALLAPDVGETYGRGRPDRPRIAHGSPAKAHGGDQAPMRFWARRTTFSASRRSVRAIGASSSGSTRLSGVSPAWTWAAWCSKRTRLMTTN